MRVLHVPAALAVAVYRVDGPACSVEQSVRRSQGHPGGVHDGPAMTLEFAFGNDVYPVIVPVDYFETIRHSAIGIVVGVGIAAASHWRVLQPDR